LKYSMPLDTIKETSSGDYDKADVERYIAELMSDFSRVKSVMQRNIDVAKAEKERVDKEREELLNDREALSSDREAYLSKSEDLERQVQEYEEKMAEMALLQADIEKVEGERMALAAKLDAIEDKSIQNAEDLQVVLEEKLEIESQNQMLQDAYEEALEKIRLLTQEKEDAVLSEQEAKEQLSEQSRLYDVLASELDSLKSVNEELEEELNNSIAEGRAADYFQENYIVDSDALEDDKTDVVDVDQEYEDKFGVALVTDSGMELFRMLRGIVNDGTNDNGVRLTKAWEEETEETIPSDTPDGSAIIKKTRKRSEVSVEYINAKNN